MTRHLYTAYNVLGKVKINIGAYVIAELLNFNSDQI